MSQQMSETAIGTERASGPGPRLQEARTARGWSVAEVAERLNLPPRHILAIEKGDFNSLPEPTYVRGYLRSYALLVGLETRAVLEAYERAQHPLPRIVAPAEETEPESDELEPVPEGDRPGRALWVPVGSVAAVLILGWVLWRHHVRSVPAAGNGLAPAVAARGHENTPTRGHENAPAPNYAPAVIPPPNVPAPKQELPPPPVVMRPASPGVAPPTAGSPPHPAAARPETTRKSASAPPFLVGANQYGHIVLSVAARARVEIRDATQLVLLSEELPPGQTVTLNGVPPFTVSLTNAQGAQLRYNGHLLNIRRFMKGKTATVVLGAQGQ